MVLSVEKQGIWWLEWSMVVAILIIIRLWLSVPFSYPFYLMLDELVTDVFIYYLLVLFNASNRLVAGKVNFHFDLVHFIRWYHSSTTAAKAREKRSWGDRSQWRYCSLARILQTIQREKQGGCIAGGRDEDEGNRHLQWQPWGVCH